MMRRYPRGAARHHANEPPHSSQIMQIRHAWIQYGILWRELSQSNRGDITRTPRITCYELRELRGAAADGADRHRCSKQQERREARRWRSWMRMMHG